MGTIIFTFAALIILIPLLYFLPLGFKKQGKLIIIASSLFLALIGLLANTVFELWQTSLLLLLFALAATFLIEKRLSSYVFADTPSEVTAVDEQQDLELGEDEVQYNDSKKHGTEPVVSISQEDKDSPNTNASEIEENEHKEILDQIILTNTYDQDDSTLSAEEIKKEHLQEQLSENDSPTLEVSTSDMDHQTDLDVNEIIEKTNIDKKDDVIEIDDMTDDDSIIDYNIDEIFKESESETQNNNNSDIHNDMVHSNVDQIEKLDNSTDNLLDTTVETDVDDSYLEAILDEDGQEENDDVLKEEREKTEVNTSMDDEDFLLEHDKDTLLNNTKEPEEVTGDESFSDFLDTIDDIEPLEILNPKSMQEEDQVQDEPENGFESTTEGYDTLIEPSNQENKPIDEELLDADEIDSLELADSTIPVNEDKKAREYGKTRLQKQMFHTMVSQLQLSKKFLSVSQYEKRIKDHLHPNLPAQDYFTFSYLLIELYIFEHNEKELLSLINHLKDKFTDFEVIQQQLQFLEQHYCKK